jgi:hypothetical protein
MAATGGTNKCFFPAIAITEGAMLTSLSASLAPSDDESTIKVAPKKEIKDKPNGTLKLKRPPPKQKNPGNWRDGSVIEGKSRAID